MKTVVRLAVMLFSSNISGSNKWRCVSARDKIKSALFVPSLPVGNVRLAKRHQAFRILGPAFQKCLLAYLDDTKAPYKVSAPPKKSKNF